MIRRLRGWAGLAGPLILILVLLAGCAREPAGDTSIGGSAIVENERPPESLHVTTFRSAAEGASQLFAADHLERETGDHVSVTTRNGTLRVRSVCEIGRAHV